MGRFRILPTSGGFKERRAARNLERMFDAPLTEPNGDSLRWMFCAFILLACTDLPWSPAAFRFVEWPVNG